MPFHLWHFDKTPAKALAALGFSLLLAFSHSAFGIPDPTEKNRQIKLNGDTFEETTYDSRDWAATAKDAANRTTTLLHKASGAVWC